MIRQDLHVHTTFCDGQNTAQEMVEAAIKLGLSRIGFSGHSYLSFDPSYCMEPGAAAYKAEIARLKDVFRGRIEILCGIELDYFSNEPTDGYDYVIGSVHYVPCPDGSFVPVDDTPDSLRRAADRFFGGDAIALAEAYYSLVADVVRKTDCAIIGHFDLITKFNEQVPLFDTADPRYIAATTAAVEALVPANRLFEVNTGGISRGWRTTPYPDDAILRLLREKGARVILTGDTHSADTLCYEFDKWAPKLIGMGFVL